MDKICKENKCTACGACFSACPNGAISMIEDADGFLYPKINKKLCVDCKICTRVCPSNQFDFNNNDKPDAYAVTADDIIRGKSTSGGVFGVIAEYILEKGGLVCGASYDENFEVAHILVDNKNDLEKLRGSKYVQSRMNDCFKTIKRELESGRYIFFTGTPCQVAGLKKYLQKEYERLICADLICNGVPPASVFKKYLSETYSGKKILGVKFRDKKNGWDDGCHWLKVTTSDGEYYAKSSDDVYLNIFFSCIAFRKSCLDCNYAKLPRSGDFTLADCWGAPKKINDNKGISLLLVNNIKAEKIFNEIKNNFKLLYKLSLKKQIAIQPRLRESANIHPSRQDFFNELAKQSLAEAFNKTKCSDKNVACLNFHWENTNFGALLTSFALNRFLNTNGFNAQNIEYIPHFSWLCDEDKNKYFDDFRKKHLPRTKTYYTKNDLRGLNESFSNFVVGSDQVWRYEFINNDLDVFFLNFVDDDKNAVSAAASFGVDYGNKNAKPIKELDNLYKGLLSGLNSISVREKSGEQYLKSIGIEAKTILDPVFMLDVNEWNNLANEYSGAKDNIVFYTINPDIEDRINAFVNDNSLVLNSETGKNITFNTGVEEWLYKIKNCNFFITDSYHGVCFAIIFNKQFVCVNKNVATSARMVSMFENLGIKDRLYSSFEEVKPDEILNNPINYDEVNKKLKEQSAFSCEWLIDSLKNRKSALNKRSLIFGDTIQYLLNGARKDKVRYWLKCGKYQLKTILPLFNKERCRQKRKDCEIKYNFSKTIIKECKALQRAGVLKRGKNK